MYGRLEVRRAAPDGLSEKMWTFQVFTDTHIDIVIDSYTERERQTKRHGLKTVHWYVRDNHRDADLKIEQVELPEDVVAEVKQQLIDGMTVRKTYR